MEESTLPLREGLIEIDVAVDAITDANAAERCEFLIEVNTELAEVLVVRIAKREDGVLEIAVTREVLKTKLLVERLDRVGGLALAIGTGDDDGIPTLTVPLCLRTPWTLYSSSLPTPLHGLRFSRSS